jgi:threonine synthase
MIKYYSTNNKNRYISFKEAVISGLAPDKGLYMPEKIVKLTDDVLNSKSFSEMCYLASKIILDDEINDNDLKAIVFDAMNFEVPIKNIHSNIYILELFHGPTAAFKDFGARFMARIMSYFVQHENKKITILVATSGDTGSAVAKGFYKVPNIDVVILYPSGKVSYLQEKQLTTLGENISALEVKGNFDDCQHMVKEAFIDKDLNSKITLSSANSINIARLMPQSFYYIWAYTQTIDDKKSPIIFCTPSGNFGNLTGGILAKYMGINIKKFIAATNINDVVPEYLDTGVFSPRPSLQTFSNAMDVGNPSNFARMLDIYKTKDKMAEDIIGISITDSETLETIKQVYDKYKYVLDPHGAVGYRAIEKYTKKFNEQKNPIVLLETAHPAKFNDIIKKAINIEVETPKVIQEAMDRPKNSIKINNNYNELKEYLLKK